MNTIYKYELNRGEQYTTLYLPPKAQVLSVGSQKDDIVLYVLVDLYSKGINLRKFTVFRTGDLMVGNVSFKFVDTVHMNSGLVFHVFEEL